MSEWIDAKERLPEQSGIYLVYASFAGYGYRQLAHFSTNYNGLTVEMRGRKVWYDFDKDHGDYEMKSVTHWAEIPEPPMEG